MADSDWIPMGEGPGGGIYKHKTSGEWVYGDTSLGSSLPSALYEYLYIAGGGSSSTQAPARAPGERYLEFGSQGPGTYQVDANGFEIPGGGFKPKTTSSGGGGASHTYETRVDSDGSKTGIPGATYQIDLLDGSVSILSKPSTTSGTNPADQNNDGLDDSTNLAMGVYAFKGSPTGYAYGAGQPVWPNGAPYEGGSGGSGAPDLVNGKFVWDGTKFVVAPGLETPTSTNYGSLGGGTPSRALSATEQASLDKLSTANNIAQIKAQEAARRETDRAAEAAKAAAVEDAQAWQSEESAKNRAQQEAQFQATYGLSVQKFIADEQQRTEDRRLAAVDAFGKGLTSYDAKAYFDALDEAGYDINNLVRGGANLLTDAALTPSAAALGIIRGTASSGLPSTVPTIPGGSPAPGVPGAPSVPGSPPVADSGLGSVPGQSDRTTRKYGDILAQRAASEAKSVDRYIRQITSEANRALGKIPQAPDPNVVGKFNFGPGPGTYQWGMNRNIERGAEQSMYPGFGNYVPISTAPQSGGGLGPAQTAGMGRDIFTDYKRQAVLPGLANGGLAPVGQPAIVGERGPEMMIPTPQGTIVRPMEPGQAQAMMQRGTPGYAEGTTGELLPSYSGWKTTTRPRTSSVTTTQPVATTPTPVAQTGLQAPQPAYQQPAPTSGLPTAGYPIPAQTAPYPAQPIPVAASGLPATITGVGPQPDQSLLDEVRRQREATLLMNGPSPYNLKWGGMSDLYRKTYAENQAQRYGIPAEEILFQAQKARRELGGVSSSGLGRLGY